MVSLLIFNFVSEDEAINISEENDVVISGSGSGSRDNVDYKFTPSDR